MSKVEQKSTLSTGKANRRAVLTGALTALAATAAVAVPAAAGSIPDPCLVIAAERDRLKAIHAALQARVEAIAEANPLPMMGQGWPRVDRSLPFFRHVAVEHGEEIARHHITGHLCSLVPTEHREALLRWWDDERAAMERRAVETGYRRAIEECDAACDRLLTKEFELADVQATTLAGAIVRLETALETICEDQESLGADGRMALGALADLKRLTAT